MRTSNRQRKPSIAINVLAVVVAINVAGAAVYLLVTRHKQQQAANGSGSVAAAPGEPTPDVSRALRAAGLAALESGRYEEAVKRFTEAAKSSKASADLPQLMKIAMELRDRAGTMPQSRSVTTTDMTPTEPSRATEGAKNDDDNNDRVEEAKPTPVPTSRDTGKSDAQKRREREQAQREREREKERQRRLAAASAARTPSKPEPTETEQPAPTPQPGTIIVSSSPSGLTVQLDGKTLDQTPLRVTAEPGAHEIALLHNNTVVFNRRLNVVPSSVQSLDPDVSAQVALLAPPRAEPTNAASSKPIAQNDAQPTAAPSGLQTPAPQPKEETKPIASEIKPISNLDPSALYVVANPSLGLASVSTDQLADLYFGRATTLNGRKVEPILRSPSAGAGAVFFRSVLKSNTRSYRDAWQRLELSTKATPPPILANAADVWRAVSSRSGAISFALGSELNGNSTNLKPIRISN